MKHVIDDWNADILLRVKAHRRAHACLALATLLGIALVIVRMLQPDQTGEYLTLTHEDGESQKPWLTPQLWLLIGPPAMAALLVAAVLFHRRAAPNELGIGEVVFFACSVGILLVLICVKLSLFGSNH